MIDTKIVYDAIQDYNSNALTIWADLDNRPAPVYFSDILSALDELREAGEIAIVKKAYMGKVEQPLGHTYRRTYVNY